jgi:predicted permease
MTRDPMWRRYRNLLRPRPTEDVGDEVRFHLEMREAEARRAGLAPEDARAAARERFGNVAGIVAELTAIDQSREERRARAEWFDDVRQDVRFALRSLRRSPTFSAAAVGTLAIAIAANATIFSFVNALLVQPLPYARPHELVAVGGTIVGSLGEALALRERTSSFVDIAVYRPQSITLNDDLDASRLEGVTVTSNLLRMFGVAPRIGRGLPENSSDPGNGSVMLLSHGLWLRRYGANPGIVGQRVLVDGVPHTILGVMPPEFRFPSTTTQFWVPLTINRGDRPAMWAFGGRYVARMKPGVTVERASAELTTVAVGLRHLNPLWDPGDGYGKRMTVVGLQRSLVGTMRPMLLLLSACVVVVLLVACVNLANLLLARATARQRELAVRAALGGGRGRLVRQLLTESAVLAGFGGAIGFVLSFAGVRWAVALLPPEIPRLTEIRLDASVLAFTALLALTTGLAFGLLPALRATSGAAPDAARFARGGGRGVAHHRLAAALVVGEVALAVLLAITATLLVRSFRELRDVTPGFRTSRLVAARISPPAASYADKARATALFDAVLARAGALPRVESVAAVDRLPLAAPVYGIALRVAGQYEDGSHGLPMADHFQTITPAYLATMGIPIVRGRGFTEADGPNAQPVALVSASLAKTFWPDGDPIGQRIGYPFPSPWMTIVGVVPDVKLDSLRDTTGTAVYIPYGQRLASVRTSLKSDMTVILRTIDNEGAIGRELRAIVESIDRSVPVTDIRTMDNVISQSVAKPRFTMSVVTGFALAALLLGAVGIYGVMSYLVSQRAHEMGVRIALGANSRDIIGLVLGRGAWLAIGGAAIGVAAASIVTRPLRALLYGISSTDPLTFAAVPLLFVVVALVASLGPARRAMRADPVEALRAD